MNLHRFLALCHKEFCQMLRDPSSFLIGIVIPLMLIILMGSGYPSMSRTCPSPSPWKTARRRPAAPFTSSTARHISHRTTYLP